jgi:tetratricopeptide (TPR) repeat protein
LDVAKRLTEADGQHCSSWQALGEVMLASGDYAGAVEPLEKAGKLYQAWAARPLAERTKLQATEAKRSKEPSFDGNWAQPSSCFTAWSSLAEAYLAGGNVAGVATLYPQYEDLDSNLPLVAGSAQLLQGNLAAAEADFRQALQLSYTQNGFARGGMMLATRARDLDLAIAQFQGPMDEEHGTLRYWLLYGELLRAKGGSAKAEEGLSAILAKNPDSVPGWLALANEQAMAGKDNKAAVGSAAALLADRLAYNPNEGSLHAWNGEVLRLQGKLPEAAAEAEKATSLSPRNTVGWFVRARIAESAGDAARAAELRKKAGQVGAGDPLYSVLLAKP